MAAHRGTAIHSSKNAAGEPGAYSGVATAPCGKKMAAHCGAAKFREETSKKANSAVRDRIAATHNLGS
jgi:hypothetical protein